MLGQRGYHLFRTRFRSYSGHGHLVDVVGLLAQSDPESFSRCQLGVCRRGRRSGRQCRATSSDWRWRRRRQLDLPRRTPLRYPQKGDRFSFCIVAFVCKSRKRLMDPNEQRAPRNYEINLCIQLSSKTFSMFISLVSLHLLCRSSLHGRYAGGSRSRVWAAHGKRGARTYNGGLRQSSQRGPEARWVRASEGQEASASEAGRLFALSNPKSVYWRTKIFCRTFGAMASFGPLDPPMERQQRHSAFENICLKVRFTNGLTYSLTYMKSRRHRMWTKLEALSDCWHLASLFQFGIV